jgi:hypothetical protein
VPPCGRAPPACGKGRCQSVGSKMVPRQ